MEAPTVGSTSPWGTVQEVEKSSDDIIFVSTASHGGFWVSRKIQKEIFEKYPNVNNFLGSFMWWEEDCDALVIIATYPELFPNTNMQGIMAMLEHYHPEVKEALDNLS